MSIVCLNWTLCVQKNEIGNVPTVFVVVSSTEFTCTVNIKIFLKGHVVVISNIPGYLTDHHVGKTAADTLMYSCKL